MTTKLKIDLSQGILEVEGSETFVKAIYSDFKAQFIQGENAEEQEEPTRKPRRTRKSIPTKTKADDGKSPGKAAEPAVVEPAPIERAAPVAKVPAPMPAYARVENLDLGATSKHPSLVEFMDSKLPITNEERNLVFLY